MNFTFGTCCQAQLRAEIVQLQEQLSHPPAVLRLKADNEALRCQLAYLKTLTSQSLQQQRSNELLEVFHRSRVPQLAAEDAREAAIGPG